jgi:anaerobic selenocysteine-containing dehydrogenase/Fe-S-cluster-containing dehydrogenase component
MNRRLFLGSALGVLGASLLDGCKPRLPRYLVPNSAPPDDAVPGLAREYRTVCRECPAGCGATARVREGRAVKLDGSSVHPISGGALCPRGQSAIESLYSPLRLTGPQASGKELSWDQAIAALADGVKRAVAAKKQVVVLTRDEPGKLGALFGSWLAALGEPASQVVTFEPMARSWLREGQKRAFGSEGTPLLDLAGAKLLVSIGDDFVEEGSPVESARNLADHRAAGGRFVYVGPRISLTGAAADEWHSVEPRTELALVLGLARLALESANASAALPAGALDALKVRLAPYGAAAVASRTGLAEGVIRRLASSLIADRPSLVTGPGRAIADADAASLAEAIYVLNALLGNVGSTLRFLPAAPARPGMTLAELTLRAGAGDVGAVIVHHADPFGYGGVYGELCAALARVPFIASFTNHLDTTARRAQLVLADHHFLEAWSDVPTRPGVLGIQQPAMTPVFGTRAAADVLIAAARALGKTSGLPDASFGEFVRQAYSDKDVEQGGQFTAVEAAATVLAPGALASIPALAELRGPAGGFPLVSAPSFRHLDGLAPTSELLEEIPDPLSGYAWSGWVEVNPATAAALGVKAGDVVALEGPGGHVELPAHVTRTIRAGVIAVPVGNTLALLDGKGGLGFGVRVTARPTGAVLPTPLDAGADEQHHRALARSVSRAAPSLPQHAPLPSMYPPVVHPNHRWGMAVDLDRCNGCGACTAACYVENNLAIVGASDSRKGRSMSWMRIESFVDDGPDGPVVSVLPVGCQHCTNAPCEAVCPTYATYHTEEGLNEQVYVRCIGTRYCENNCPYGVRRFNFADWTRSPTASLGLNPDVSVRERGVTEKCTLCSHRIRTAEEQAKVEKRPLRDGELTTACAATCPAHAIVFGDLKDPASRVSQLAADARSYKLLEELNTQPGVFYLARRRDKV